jgi:hypothetical protein
MARSANAVGALPHCSGLIDFKRRKAPLLHSPSPGTADKVYVCEQMHRERSGPLGTSSRIDEDTRIVEHKLPNADGSLAVTNSTGAQTPLSGSDKVLLTVDVWEHAYCIDYRNQRPKFVDSYLAHLVNWPFAASNFA